MKNRDNFKYFCTKCGESDQYSKLWYSFTLCNRCHNRKSRVHIRRNYLSFARRGELCEDWVMGETVRGLSHKYEIISDLVDDILSRYMGLGEKPIQLSFIPKEGAEPLPVIPVIEEVVNILSTSGFALFEVDQRVRIINTKSVHYGETKKVKCVSQGVSGYLYCLEYIGATKFKEACLKACDPVEEIRSFNI